MSDKVGMDGWCSCSIQRRRKDANREIAAHQKNQEVAEMALFKINDFLISYFCRDEKLHTVQLQTEYQKEERSAIERLINKMYKRHKPIKIKSINEVI